MCILSVWQYPTHSVQSFGVDLPVILKKAVKETCWRLEGSPSAHLYGVFVVTNQYLKL